MKSGKYLTREQKRAAQRRRANALGIGIILALLAAGALIGRFLIP